MTDFGRNLRINLALEMSRRGFRNAGIFTPLSNSGLRNTADTGDHASNDIANIGGFLDRLIPRISLRPGYGEGWKTP
jgi:hypothetical protein